MSLFICPLCRQPLEKSDKNYICENGHCYDISSDGYSNLLLANQKKSKIPGDSKEMVNSRNLFLSKDYYSCLRNALCNITEAYADKTGGNVLLDCGCGDGYYTSAVCRNYYSAKINSEVAAIDISKHAVKKAAKRRSAQAKSVNPDAEPGSGNCSETCIITEFAVASAYNLPVDNESVNIVMNVFSPLCTEELLRVLKPGGFFIYVVPGARHLWQMKELLYDRPYENEVSKTEYDGFKYKEVVKTNDNIHLKSKQDIEALFTMTPYFWRTPREGTEKLLAADELSTEIDFDIHIFEKC